MCALKKCWIEHSVISSLFDHKMVRLSSTLEKKVVNRSVIKDNLLKNELVKTGVHIIVKDTYLVHVNPDSVPGPVRRQVSEHVGMCLFYLEEVQKIQSKLSSEKNRIAINNLNQQLEINLENLTANLETLPDLEWFENLELECGANLFFETLINNIRNMVLKMQNNIYKAKNLRQITLKGELELLKKNYIDNQQQIFTREKELSRLIETELKSELALIKGFERLNDEKITPHFLQMAKNLQKPPELSVINTPEEEKLTGDPDTDRTEYILKFYGDLYSVPSDAPILDENSIPAFLGSAAQTPEVVNAKLTQDEKVRLDSPLNIAEFDTAVKQLKTKSAPGRDGINNRFIRAFWPLVRAPLFLSTLESYESGFLSENFSTAKIKLIPKKGDITKINNWRPISLLNCFYKLVSRVLTNRLSTVMDKITKVGQKGYSKTKQCQEVLISLIDGVHAARQRGKNGLLISLDMKKAFDSISHDYLKNCLQFLGFGDYFTKWVMLVSTNRKACIEIGKNKTTKTFNLGRGNAQGDVISPFLFNIGYQILLLKLEKDEGITGFYDFPDDTANFEIPATVSRATRKVFAFADDGNLLVEASLNNINRIKKILSDFSKLSGLECNIEKSAMMQVGIIADLNDEIINSGFRIEKSLKILGSTLVGNCTNFEENWDAITAKIQQQINIWSRFNLSLNGRINIAKTMLYSQINYNGCYLPIPADHSQIWESMITRFVTGRIRISQDRIFLPVKHGGLGLFPVREFIGAQKCSWILRARSNDEIWKINFNRKNNNKLDFINKRNFSKTHTPLFYDWSQNWGAFYAKFSEHNFLNVKIIDNDTLTLHLRTRACLTLANFNDLPDLERHFVAIQNLRLAHLLDGQGNTVSLDRFRATVNLPLNRQHYALLLRILATARTRHASSGSDSVDTYFRAWKKGSKKIRNVMCSKNYNTSPAHNIVKFGDTTDTVISIENAQTLNTQWWYNFYSPAQKAFLFKLHNNILGINTRVSHFNRQVDRNCEFCNIIANPDPEDESILHLFYDCSVSERVRIRFFTEILGRDISRTELFVTFATEKHSKNFILKILANLFMYFIWESKKRFCIPSYGLLQQFIHQEMETITLCSPRVKNLLRNSELRL
jgi:hypothetical protein